MNRSLVDEFQARGMFEQVTNEAGLREHLARPGAAFYIGFDPTADSLHVGSLLPVMALAHVQRAGHRPIALVGGATGMIGDPSGRSSERNLLTAEQVAENCAGIRRQLEHFISFEGRAAAMLVDNHDWIGAMSFIEWLRDVGKHFTVNYMMAKESVRRRLEDREHGISYTEFSYMTLQAYDFYHLYEKHGCRVQGGGSDQWGNITAGIELIRRKAGVEAFGITFPLVKTASGEKFGKSAGNAIWLDPKRTSPYEFYQFWVRTDDRDVENYLKYFTFLEVDEIETLCSAHRDDPGRREAQKRLAAEVTRLVHGEEGLNAARQASQALFGGDVTGMSDRELLAIFADVPSTEVERGRLEQGYPLVELLADSGACKSRGEARRLVRNGGAYLNNQRLDDPEKIIGVGDLASESVLILRTGKKNYRLVKVV
ncbi:MAG: tyrosine--tRNA ligase [Acidobacteriota bacterium]|nr:tyrosine--tRNA ligase [Acidobacteriota bacterium]MDQ7087404.1 tyrosine--tRNA ligase [Acidobacteriota bacterium]